jgi:release factor glutamine methyltransferase
MVEIPKEYKDGFKIFLGQRIDLSKYPLIPREETEYWTLRVIDEIKEKENIYCLDLFSGSGCIGSAVLKNTKAFCDFGEIEDNFLEQIKKNVELLGIENGRYDIFKTNIFSGISKKYDYILANPPYVAEKRMNDVGVDVIAFEPKIALFSGMDGMSAIRVFLDEAKNYLKVSGIIFLEFDPQQKKEIENILQKNKYSSWEFFYDQFGLVRFARIVL